MARHIPGPIVEFDVRTVPDEEFKRICKEQFPDISGDEWFIFISKDWGWLRRTWFVASWPLWYLWARVRMWGHQMKGE